MHGTLYSGTSDSGPFEIGTLYNNNGHQAVRSPKNYMPYSFRTSKRGQPLYNTAILSPACPSFGGSTVIDSHATVTEALIPCTKSVCPSIDELKKLGSS